ncbi:protein kinase [Halobacillus salinarum]|uniref:non-specific serine/threonine protein kinase n=1 Tax=Halobacillus salinarum TaxID=2932257 RepID=A0ABY4EL07_9BACI|nr:protein kinase [Halobacillus salinarum]UOQ44660.1 protein kinase [Halobacillus salinarum]
MKKPDFNIREGAVLKGKWNSREYQIIRKLGSGACGTVYLCQSKGVKYALKVGLDSSRMMLEVNMLKKFSKVQGVKLGPYFVDVDDWVERSGKTLPFYVMEYVHGVSLHSFLQGKTKEWIGLCAVQLLVDLEHLHKAGFIFGDLKTDNLLVSGSRLRWIDVGGVTSFDRAIKEYTEFYDRGYWDHGSRRAEPGYDLFALTMIMLEMAYPKRFEKGKDPKKTLEAKLGHSVLLKPYQKIIQKCWQGKYQSASEMKDELAAMLMKTNKKTATNRASRHNKKESFAWGEITAVSVVVGVIYGMSIWSGLM